MSVDFDRAIEAILGRPWERMEPAARGGNSQVFRIEAGGEFFALKKYPSAEHDTRNRLGSEAAALRFMHDNNFTDVPALIGEAPDIGVAIFEWIEGAPIAAPTEDDIDDALDFLQRVYDLRDVADARVLPDASEACLSGGEILQQIDHRVRRLSAVRADNAALDSFVGDSLTPVLANAARIAHDGYENAGIDFDEPIPRQLQSLIPADFGFHNSLRRPDGQIFFVDFEYFGWDDPAKLTSDMLWHPHPAMSMADDLKSRLLKGMCRIHGRDRTFETRQFLTHPLYGLRWVLILLNEFLPERWEARAKVQEIENWEQAKEAQLNKAEALLARVRQSIRGLVDGE